VSERSVKVATGSTSEQARHLRPVERIERRGPKFAAYAHDVARVLGPHRGAAAIYGLFASAWFEFAAPAVAEGKKRPAPGDWVEISYKQLMDISGTNSKDSVIRWLRILAEDVHPCLQGRCGAEHPLIVVKRQGRTRPNRYRKWRCGEDEFVLRPQVRSQKLSEAARRRVEAGQIPTAIEPASAAMAEDQLALLAESLEVRPSDFKQSAHQGSESPDEVRPSDFKDAGSDVRSSDCKKSGHQTSQEVRSSDLMKSGHRTSYTIENDIKLEIAAATEDAAAAIEAASEVDAVACEIIDAILNLAQRVEPAYTDHQAWAVARRLAGVALATAQRDAATARVLLLCAISDRRLARARNPVGLLIRGVEGDDAGHDRFLISGCKGAVVNSPTATKALEDLAPGMREMLLEAVSSGAAIDARWLRGRDVPPAALHAARKRAAEEASSSSETPLGDELAARDETEYRRRLEEILAVVEIPSNLGLRRSLDHPMLLGMCRARLERELSGER
jgi:hypothetical protein